MKGRSVTGVGSLPHTDADQAAAFVLSTTDLPYLPQLPHRHPEEAMLVQWGDGLCGCGVDPDGLGLRAGAPCGPRKEAFGGARRLLASLPEPVPALKTQATGPVTLALAMMAGGRDGRGLWDCVLEGLLRRTCEHLEWLEGQLPGTEVMLVLDEPALAGLRVSGFPIQGSQVRAVLREVIDRLPVRPGIHCCADTDWELVAYLRPAWISWDVSSLHMGDIRRAAEPLAQAVMEGTRLIWGVVPPTVGPLPTDEELVERLRRVEEELVVAGASLRRLTEEAVFSPGCGLAGLTEEQAWVVGRRVGQLAGELTAHG